MELVHIPLLRRSSADPHGSVAAIDTLHLLKSTLLITLFGEANETVATRLASVGIGHDLGGLARWEAGLEERHQNVLGDLWSEVANEDGELRAAIVAVSQAISELTFRGWVEEEHTDGRPDHHQKPS